MRRREKAEAGQRGGESDHEDHDDSAATESKAIERASARSRRRHAKEDAVAAAANGDAVGAGHCP